MKRESKSSDIKGVWVDRVSRSLKRLQERFWTVISRLQCHIWGVKIGENCKFWGRTYIRRTANSEISIGSDCRFRSAFWSNMVGVNRPCFLSTLRPEAKIVVGDRTGLSGTVVSAAKSISIGSNVLCGANVTITDTDWHNLNRAGEEELEDSDSSCAPVVIKDNVWLGLNVLVLKGVTIGENSVVAPNSVVTRDIPDGVLFGGQPAKFIKTISDVENQKPD